MAWNGRSLSPATRLPLPASADMDAIGGVSCPAVNRCVVLGYAAADGEFVWTWNGTAWSRAQAEIATRSSHGVAVKAARRSGISTLTQPSGSATRSVTLLRRRFRPARSADHPRSGRERWTRSSIRIGGRRTARQSLLALARTPGHTFAHIGNGDPRASAGRPFRGGSAQRRPKTVRTISANPSPISARAT